MNKAKQLFAGLILMALGLGTAQADYTLNLMKGVTKVSNDIYDLHMLILWICVFIGIGVFGTMFYSIYHHRKSRGHQAAQFHRRGGWCHPQAGVGRLAGSQVMGPGADAAYLRGDPGHLLHRAAFAELFKAA